MVIAAVAGVVLLAVVLVAVAVSRASRNADIRGVGALSAQTQRADVTTSSSQHVAAADVEAQARADREAVVVAPQAPVAEWVEPTPETIALSRRQFFNRATISLVSIGAATSLAAAFVAFLWPSSTGGFGGQVNVGKIDTVKQGIKQGNGFFYAPEARAWITEYPAEALPLAEASYPESVLVSMREGLTVLSQKCPHLGCRVPECATSQWFECQCHGSQYNRAGEKKAGPAPRGMDRYPASVSAAGDVLIDTSNVVPGPAIGVNTTGQEAEGPHCTSGGEH